MSAMPSTGEPGPDPCLICGSCEEPTVEHIIPQTLWNRFGIDPDREDLAQYRTTLCDSHNGATSVLHTRTEMMELIEAGSPVTRKTLQHLGDWAVWVTLLLGLARGSGVLGAEASKAQLLRRFDTNSGGTPKGVRVYAARVDKYVAPTEPPIVRYTLALHGDSRVVLDDQNNVRGFSVQTGPINASESIGLGKIALLVVSRTYSSGNGHLARLDQAAASVGLELILPLPTVAPKLDPASVSMTDVGRLFTVLPFGADPTLLPEVLRGAWAEDCD